MSDAWTSHIPFGIPCWKALDGCLESNVHTPGAQCCIPSIFVGCEVFSKV